MSKEAVFTMKLEPELREQFITEAAAAHRPASQVVRELMREFVERQRLAREYEAFLKKKVSVSRTSIKRGNGLPNEEVEASFARRRANVLRSA
jgi:predicted transcriptional regulator